ncbi:MAG: hypothetical protein ACXWKG_09775, partial [Limisphaerales bacterium]
MKLINICCAVAVFTQLSSLAEEVHDEAVVLNAASPIANSLADDVRISGYDVHMADADALNDATLKGVSLLVVPNGRSLPDSAAKPIENFLKAGGHLIAAGLPSWQNSTTSPTNLPYIEAFSPNYIFYPVTGDVLVSTPADIALVTAAKKPLPLANSGDLWAMHP